MMRKLAIVMALASTALATPALARDKAWYVGVEGGAMIVEDIDWSVTGAGTGAASRSGTATVDHDYGWDVDGIVGYDFGAFRLETEVGYRRASIDSLRTTAGLPISATAQANPGTFDAVGGRTSALSFMVNGLLDFGEDDGLQGFVGGGAGVARVQARIDSSSNYRLLDDSDTVFAWQALAGIRAPLSENVDVSLKYRFFNADNVKLFDARGSAYDGRFRSHSLLGGVTYNFGAPEEAAPPPPPPPPPEVVCSPGPFIVFFEWNKSDVTPEAGSILDNAVTQYQSCNNAQVMLAGYTDTSGAAKYNVGLSQRRADAVKAYMASKGIPDGVMTTEAFGETRLRVETADGVREVQNRRVEITYGPGSGQ